MEWARQFLTRMISLFRKRKLDAELDDELRFHLEMEEQQNIRSGMEPAEARRQARFRLGGVEQVKEEYRERRGIPFVESVFQDVRVAIRSFHRDRGFTATVLCALVLGIGIGTAIFAVVNGVLLQPLPYKDPDRLVALWRVEEGAGAHPEVQRSRGRNIARGDFFDWRDDSGLFESAVNIDPSRAKFEEIRWFLAGEFVDRDFCGILGVQAALGRCLAPDDFEADAPAVVLLQYDAWKNHFGGDPDIVGTTYHVSDFGERQAQVIGVMPPGFFLLSRGMNWFMPFPVRWNAREDRSQFNFWAIGRLKADLSLKEAQARADVFSQNLAERFPDSNAGRRIDLTPLSKEASAGLREPLLLLLASAGLVLLIVCSNVAGLVMVRALSRSTEFAVRSAIGAGRLRLIRQVITENAVLSTGGGLLGLGLAMILVEYLRGWAPSETRWSNFFVRSESISIDPWVIAFALGLALCSGGLFGLLPAFKGTSLRLATWLKEGSGSALGSLKSHRAGRMLSIAQVSLAVVLGVAACLLVRSFLTLQQRGPGFRPEGVIGLDIFAGTQGRRGPVEQKQWWSDVREALQTIPGVTGVTNSFVAPIGAEAQSTLWIEKPGGVKAEPVQGLNTFVDTDYFEVLNIPLIEGRGFDLHDERGAPRVAIVNEEAARLFWPGENTLGKTLRHAEDPEARWSRRVTVVGVVGDVRAGGLQRSPEPIVYEAADQIGHGSAYWMVRSTRDPDSLFPEIVGRLRAIDPGVTILQPGYQELEVVVRDSTWQLNYTMVLLTGLAGLALLISAVGVYGVLSYTVRQRTREIGLRIALGAGRSDVMRMVMRQGLSIALPGVIVGAVVSAGLMRFLSSIVYGVEALDGLTFTLVGLVMLAASLLASYVPAARAASLDPTAALRCE